MRRTFVTTSEHAGHPFRRSLPQRVTRALPEFEPEVIAAQRRAEARAGAMRLRSPDLDPMRITRSDVRDFLLAYFACFLAVSLWIA